MDLNYKLVLWLFYKSEATLELNANKEVRARSVEAEFLQLGPRDV